MLDVLHQFAVHAKSLGMQVIFRPEEKCAYAHFDGRHLLSVYRITFQYEKYKDVGVTYYIDTKLHGINTTLDKFLVLTKAQIQEMVVLNAKTNELYFSLKDQLYKLPSEHKKQITAVLNEFLG